MTTKERWLLRPPSPHAAARLFCLPYPGCGASMYRRWPRYLGPVEVCPVQLPGRENRLREPHYSEYEELARSMAAGLQRYLDRPFAFFGHCAGALPCLEAALHMGRSAAAPARLFVSSQPAPHEQHRSRFAEMDDAALEHELTELVAQLGGSPGPALLAMGLQVLRADIEAFTRYQRHAPAPLTCPITLIGWTEDTEVPVSAMSGWSEYGMATHRTLPGGHYEFLRAPDDLMNAIISDLPATAGTGNTD